MHASPDIFIDERAVPGVRRLRVHELQDDFPVETTVPGAEDLAGGPTAEPLEDLQGPQGSRGPGSGALAARSESAGRND